MKARLMEVLLNAAVSLLTLISTLSSAAQTFKPCHEVSLPTLVNKVLNRKFPLWRPKQVSDMDADHQQLWLKAHEKECPGIAVGHFESADRLAYAVLLVPRSEPSGGYKLVVFSKGPNGDTYTWKLLDRADGQTYSGLVISKAAPGKYSEYERTRSIQTKLDGVYVEWIEKGAQLYYWSGGRYRKLQVSG